MEQLDPPDVVEWDERRIWFERLEEERARHGAGQLSEQACALMIELQTVFCAGAWAAAIVLAATIADSQMIWAREDVPQSLRDELSWLRQARNALLHENPREPALTVEDQWMHRKRWERQARRAVEAAVASLYAGAAPQSSSGMLTSNRRQS